MFQTMTQLFKLEKKLGLRRTSKLYNDRTYIKVCRALIQAKRLYHSFCNHASPYGNVWEVWVLVK